MQFWRIGTMCARARTRARYKNHYGTQPTNKSTLINDHYANLQPPWVLHVGILTSSYLFKVFVLWDHVCARTRARYKGFSPGILELDQIKSLNGVTLRVNTPKESIKTLSKHPSSFLFEILALLGICDMFHVTNGGLNFGWLSGHKI